MYYKIIILTPLSVNKLHNLLKQLSKFYIIIIPPNIEKYYYIVYIIVDNIKNIVSLNNYIIFSYNYNKTIYKILFNYIKFHNKFENIDSYHLLDNKLHNLSNIYVYNHLPLKLYLEFLNTILTTNIYNNIIKCINNYIKGYLKKILWIYNSNNNILNTISNLLLIYNSDIYLISDYINSTNNIELNHHEIIYNKYYKKNKPLKYIIIFINNTINFCYKKLNQFIYLYYKKLIKNINNFNLDLINNKNDKYYQISKLNIMILSNNIKNDLNFNKYNKYIDYINLI